MHARLDRWALVAALVGVPLVAAALIPLRGHIENTNIALILVVVVVAVACSGSRLAAAAGRPVGGVLVRLLLHRPVQLAHHQLG